MEEGGIEAVLAKAIDLRLKISNYIHKASTTNNNSPSSNHKDNNKEEEEKIEGVEESSTIVKADKKKTSKLKSFDGENLNEAEDDDDDDEEEETERLLHIKDAIEALEHQLSSLQALQQQQRYEREVALSEIEHSRKMLLNKLKEYKGEELEVIQEASLFAGETVESNTDLLLPPYPSRPPQSLVVDNRYLSHFPSTRKSMRNGVITGEAKKNPNELESNHAQTASHRSNNGFGHVIGTAARTVITIVGVISVLSLSGLGPTVSKKGIPLRVLGLFRQHVSKEKRRLVECPPGRVLAMEDGEARCVVKERVAVPFESVVTKPDVNYGCG